MSNPEQVFNVNPNVAKPLAIACEALVAEYRLLVNDAQHIKQLGGFGTLKSGLALQEKFQEKAFGSPDSLVNALESHITVVDGMRAYFQKCIDNAAMQEQQNVDSLRGVGRIN
ncbi:hypothetical protein ACFRFQ_21895 [Rhodococcus sp. NPDC056743]|uniref:hypothetical protein n=1 Tax=Rhodococcus sp. NPDC056743 TaxID=3345934 RepID=UPI00366F9660